MQIKELMTEKPEYLSPDTSLKTAADKMLKHNFGFIPVGENDRLIGTVTDRDIALRAVAKGKDPNKTPLREIMSKQVFYCFEDDDIQKAAKYMAEKQIRRLIVLNKDKRMIGIVSLGDIATHCNNLSLSGDILEKISESEH